MLLRLYRRHPVTGDVPAARLAAEHGVRHPVTIQQRGEGQTRVGRAARQHLVRAVHRQGPGDRGAVQRIMTRHPQFRPPPVEALAVVLAGHPRRADDRRRLAQGQRLAAEVLDEVHRAAPLIRIRRKPGHEVTHGLAAAEGAQLQHGQLAEIRHRPVAGRGQQQLAGPAGWPEALHDGAVRQVIQHDEPAPLSAAQPGQERRGDRVRGAGHPGLADRGRGLAVTSENGLPAARVDPHEQVDGARVPLRFGVIRGELRLAADLAPHGAAGLAGDHRHQRRRARVGQRRAEVRRGLGSGAEPIGEQRH